MPLAIRGGYTILKNPVKVASLKTQYRWSFGLGFDLSEQIAIDMGYAHTQWDGIIDSLIDDEKIEADKLLISLNYSFSARRNSIQ